MSMLWRIFLTSIIASITVAGAAGVVRATDSPFTFEPVKPRLQINIPTFKLSDVRARTIEGEPTDVSIPWIGEYIAALYRWAVPVGAILATVVIMIAGVIWLTSGGAGTLSTAKEWITNAVIGLLLLVGSYVVLNLVNPDLVRLQALRVKIVTPKPIEDDHGQADGTCGDTTQQTGRQQCLVEYVGGSEQAARGNLVPVTYRGRSISINKNAAGDLREVFNELEENAYSMSSIGTFNWRCNRNNPAKLSLHSFGLSLDINPNQNPNCRSGSSCFVQNPLSLPKEQRPFDLPDDVIAAFKRHNFEWGGDWKSVKDYMHFDWKGHGC